MSVRRRPSAARRLVGPIDELSGTMLRGLRDALRGAPIKPAIRKRLAGKGLIEKNPEQDRFSRLTPLGMRVLRAAIHRPTQGEDHDN